MQIIRWDKRFVVGIPYLDREHERIFQELNRIYGQYSNRINCQDIQRQFAFFIEHVFAVFSEEENCMRTFDYLYYQEHAREHRQFLEKLMTLNDGEDKEVAGISRFSFTMIGNLLSSHILQSDFKFAETLLRAGDICAELWAPQASRMA
jgi:hemerythrin-like metal-binding protein